MGWRSATGTWPVCIPASRRVMMVDTQVRPSDVTKFPIIDAMLSVPREVYVPDDRREAAYVGENVDLGGGRVILEPRTLAKLLDALDIQPTELVLDIGCGYGYSAAVIAHLAEAIGDTQSAVRTAKSGIADRKNLFYYAYPVHPFPAYSPRSAPG